jgi:ATP-binding cassette subfamily B protein
VIFGTSAALLEPRLFGYAIDEAIVPKDWDKLRIIGTVFFFVVCIRVLSAARQGYFFELLGQKVTQDLRVQLFAHLQSLPVSTLDCNPVGRLLTRVTNDVAALNEMFSAGFVSILCNILLVFGILFWLMILDFKLGLIASSVFPVLAVISLYFSKKLQFAYRDSRNKLSALNAFLAENLAGMKIVQLFNRQEIHLNRFIRLCQWYAEAQISSIRVYALFQPAITISSGLSIALIIWFGGRETLAGNLKVGVLVAYFSYSMSLFQPVREIADKWNIILSGMTAAERIFSLLAWNSEMKEGEVHKEALPIPSIRGRIVFENVWFAYQGENWVLKDFNLEIHPGEKIGVVGHTGAGKTTIISLLLRFYEPQKGRIFLDGKELNQYDKRALRASIGIVQQDVFLFSGTFEQNISFWKEISKEKLKGLLTQVGLRNRFESETFQERGSNFSMGERQVIAFARALAKEPKIWILDEATANLDSKTEAVLHQALDVASAQCTTLFIAHRLATVRNADRILVLNQGSLVECGNHDELMQKNGFYHRLYRYQETQPQSHFV